MTKLATLLLAVLGLVLFAATRDARAEDGKQVFLKHECNECHTVEVLGVAKLPEDASEADEEEDLGEDEEETEPPDLSGIGKRRDRDWLGKWLQKKVENDEGKKHRKRFKGSDADLEAIVAFLAGLQTDAPPQPGK
jgi:mono/diheme cytochrome c family protein